MRHLKSAVVVVTLGLSAPVLAAVSEAEAAKLGAELTPTGAEKGANADGTIPAWTGGLTQPPAGYKVGDPSYKDPFASEKPLLSINAKNVEEHRAKLSEGQVEMVKRFPDFAINVYPSHRTFAVPEKIYKGTRENAVKVKLVADGAGLEGAVPGIPFPLPKNGNEAVWNHIFRYRGDQVVRKTLNAPVNPDGSYTMGRAEVKVLFIYKPEDNRLFYYRQHTTAPARAAGTSLLIHEPLNQSKELRVTWIYSPGLRRVRRVTNVAYDTPTLDGIITTDQVDMFNGDVSRYEWKLVGKQEMYVPYNNYRLQSPEVDYSQVIKPKHLNGDHLRYELHRVWKVEAKLKAGVNHIYATRTFYLDEDSWSLLEADQYDAKGNIWRVGEGYAMSFYDVPVTWYSAYAVYDLQNGRYAVVDINNNRSEKSYNFTPGLSPDEFTPAALVREGMR